MPFWVVTLASFALVKAKPEAESSGDGVVAWLGFDYQLLPVCVELLEAIVDSCFGVAIVVVVKPSRGVVVLPQGL